MILFLIYKYNLYIYIFCYVKATAECGTDP